MATSFLHNQLADALTSSEDPSRLQVIVAPTSGAALSLRTAAARMGVPLVNVEAVTVPGLALHVWRSMKPFDAGRLASRDRLVIVLAAHLQRLKKREADLLRPSLARVAAAIEADRMAGRGSAWAASSARSPLQKAYADLFGVYETHLGEQGVVDMADVQQQASDLAAKFCSQRDLDTLLVCSDTPVLPALQPLLETLGMHARSRYLLGTPQLVTDLEGPWAQRVLQGWSFAKPDALESRGKPVVLQAATRRDEVWMVLSDIMDRAVPFDDVELVVSDRETYGPLIEAACDRLGIPTTLQTGNDEDLHTLHSAITDYLSWIASGYQARHLGDLMRTPGFDVAGACQLTAHQIADLLGRFQMTPSMLSKPDLNTILEEGARRDRISPADVSQLVTWMQYVRTFVPDAVTTPARFGKGIRMLVESHFSGDEIRSVQSRFVERLLETIEDMDSHRVEASWMAAFLLENLHKETSNQDFGNGLHVTNWDEAGYGPRGHAYVLGLDDQASGSQSLEESTHVAGLDPSQPKGYGRPIPARRRLRDLLSRFGHRLTATLPAWDIRASRSLFPGSALVDAVGLEEVVAQRRSNRLDAADAERQKPGRTGASFEGVKRGLNGQVQRNSERWTAYDGQTGAQEAPISVRLSPSRMEQYLACPYRYFLSSVLGLDALPEEDEDWMDRAAEGSILHDLFEEHTRARVAKVSGIELSDEQQMLHELKNSLERQASRSGVDPEAFLDARFRELAHGVHRYFDRERQLAGERKPVHAEFSFSDHPKADAPSAIFGNENGEITLTGRVDRIDESTSGEWIIVDYKTGKPEGFVPDKLLKMDDKLQWALYAWAVSQVSEKNVIASEYVFTSKKGGGWVSRVAAPASEQVDPLFDSVLERLKSGHFIPAPDEQKTCTWCDFKAVCGDLGERKAAIQAKFADADPQETRAFEGWSVREKNLSSS